MDKIKVALSRTEVFTLDVAIASTPDDNAIREFECSNCNYIVCVCTACVPWGTEVGYCPKCNIMFRFTWKPTLSDGHYKDSAGNYYKVEDGKYYQLIPTVYYEPYYRKTYSIPAGVVPVSWDDVHKHMISRSLKEIEIQLKWFENQKEGWDYAIETLKGSLTPIANYVVVEGIGEI